ncbi:uncharacterized protein LDX57_001191 [Aspergillus melleus]|uniref:uncharacterized protein n=1 Tax=Aspergillus melleus TaxID=138277 RepID=UPI001E8DED54|nr:uncharacterized protein LDX57_001191 [Aspergillus melleus]KAH8423430.1 hypothetical protein LDX57_001191 [Aspergillus melleus]
MSVTSCPTSVPAAIGHPQSEGAHHTGSGGLYISIDIDIDDLSYSTPELPTNPPYKDGNSKIETITLS